MRRALAIVAGALAFVAIAAAGRAHAQSSGCQMDTDCKGDRICDAGVCRAPDLTCAKDTDCPGDDVCAEARCVAPTASTPAPPPPPPAPTLTPAPVSTPETAPAAAPPPTTPPTATVASAPPPPAPADEVEAEAPAYVPARPRRRGLAADFEGSLGFVHAGDSSYMFLGESSALGAYLSDNVALMAISNYDIVFSDPGVKLGVIGGGLRFTRSESNNSLRVGLGAAWVSDPAGYMTSTGLGLTVDALLTGRGHMGVGVDLTLASIDSITIVRLGASFAFFR